MDSVVLGYKSLLPRVSLNNVSLYRGFPLNQFLFPWVSAGNPRENTHAAL